MTDVMPFVERVALAEKLRAARAAVAAAVTEEFLVRHPEWLTRYGELARVRGVEDAAFHVDYLAGAVEAGTASTFEDYARWTARVLAARGIAPEFVNENLEQVERAARPYLAEAEAGLVARFVAAGRAACLEPPSAANDAGQGPLSQARAMFVQAILAGQRKAALTVAMEALRAGAAPIDVYVDVLQAALYEVGRLWESNRITVAEEHMATAVTQYVVAQLYAQLPEAEPTRGRMVITGVEGELHQVGANMVSDVLEADGWDVRFLGSNLPHAGILKAVEEHRADVLGISCAMIFNLPRVVALVRLVRSAMGERAPRIVCGGNAFRRAPEVYKELGADAFAPDLRGAVETLRAWSRAS